MNRKFPLAIVCSLILLIGLLLPACGGETPTATPTKAAAATAIPATAAPVATATAQVGTPTKAAAAATVTKTPKLGGTLVNAQNADGTGGHYDCNMFTTNSQGMWWNSVYETLLTHDASYAIVPNLATKWDISPDGKTVTLSIRQGVKWQNVAPVSGREFTSADVKWNLERIRDLKAGSTWTNAMKVIANIETPDKYTAKVTLTQPNAPFISTLAEPTLMMYPHELLDAYGEKQSVAAIGTGPFLFQSYEPQVAIKFVKNPDYWDKGKPYLDGAQILIIKDQAARLAALRTGQLSYLETIAPADMEALKKTNPELVTYQHLAQAYGLYLNTKKKPLDDQRVRRAINLALDRQEIVQLAFAGSGLLQSLIRPDGVPLGIARTPEELAKMPGYRQPKDADIAEAKKLLADAGYANGVTIEQLVFNGEPGLVRAAEITKAQLAKIGIDWVLKPTEFAQYFAAYTGDGNYQAAVGWLAGGDCDLLYPRLNTKGTLNVNGYGTPEMDQLLEQGRVETDIAKRVQIYRQIEDINFQQSFIVPLFNQQAYYMARPEFQNLKPMALTNMVYYSLGWKDVWVDK